jgi:pilus assembly protein CpaE
MERLVSIAEKDHSGLFFIYVSREISASDYKRLVRTGSAEWVSIEIAPEEIAEIVARRRAVADAPVAPEPAVRTKPAIAAFVPSSGGVGNTTLAIEAAVQLKVARATRSKRICLVDLDLQTSHACDYLDIEPRMRMQEIMENPERLDAQLFDLFVSHHTSGLDVLASPRRRDPEAATNIAALDVLFQQVATRYDLLILDLPAFWFSWTGQLLSVADLAIVTGVNNVAGLRQVSETLAAVRALPQAPGKIVVALNHCEPQFFGRVARKQHVKQALGSETVIYVREDPSMTGAVNTGIPMAVGSPSSKASKDVRALAKMLSGLSPQRM